MDHHCSNLQSLDVSSAPDSSLSPLGCHMTNGGLAVLCSSLNQCPLINLRYLRLYWNSVNANGMKYLAMSVSLGVLDALEVLDLSSGGGGEK